MNKTGWRQTDIRDFLCKHEFGPLEVCQESPINGFGYVIVGHQCKKCKIIKNVMGVDSGPIS